MCVYFFRWTISFDMRFFASFFNSKRRARRKMNYFSNSDQLNCFFLTSPSNTLFTLYCTSFYVIHPNAEQTKWFTFYELFAHRFSFRMEHERHCVRNRRHNKRARSKRDKTERDKIGEGTSTSNKRQMSRQKTLLSQLKTYVNLLRTVYNFKRWNVLLFNYVTSNHDQQPKHPN